MFLNRSVSSFTSRATILSEFLYYKYICTYKHTMGEHFDWKIQENKHKFNFVVWSSTEGQWLTETEEISILKSVWKKLTYNRRGAIWWRLFCPSPADFLGRVIQCFLGINQAETDLKIKAGEILKDIFTNNVPLMSSSMHSRLNGAYKTSWEGTYILARSMLILDNMTTRFQTSTPQGSFIVQLV